MTTARLAKLGLAGLVGLALAGGAAVQAAETKPPVSAAKRWESEFSMWQKVSSSSDPAGYEDYLKQFPNGTFASMARLRLAELNAAGASKPSSGAASAGTAVGEKERNEEARKAAEAERLKAEQDAKVAAEKAQAEQDRLAAEAERQRIAEEERLRKEEQARAEAEARRAAEARAEAERQAAEAERKRAQEAAEAEALRAEQEAKAEQARLKAEQEAKAAAEAQAKADAAAAEKAKAEAEQAAAEAERARAQAAAEAERLKAAEEARAAAEARRSADEAAADKAKAEAEKAQAEAERLRAAEAGAAEGEKAADVARPEEENRPAGATADALDTEALPTDAGQGTGQSDGSQAAATDDAGETTTETERQARREDNAWSRAVLNGRAQAFEGYLRVYPDGRFADQARERLSAIDKQGGTAERDVGQPAEDNAGLGGSNPGSAGADRADQGSIVSPRPAAPASREVLADPRQPTIYRTPGDAREAYLEPATRAQSQQWLSMLGYNTGGVDGVFGSRTRGAIAAWQRAAGYAADGYLTRKQYRQLGEAARYAQRRDRQYVARQRAERDRYYNDGYGVYEGPVGGYLEGPVGGYYEGPADGYYVGPRGDLTISGPGY